ncbi:MAG TPA: AAA family ATPase [Anaerohalosphaeraceae bacterium]|jgi:DNA transposition AAA+ family ATPase|nr:AAA family ATPase [Anaerohalosphaeraceae bacterium]HQI08393.1 AAA family ATPase [Anaerohalosphaeraceae bacterium]
MDPKTLQALECEARKILVGMPNMDSKDEVKHFCNKVIAFCEQYAITRGELAAAIGISLPALSQFMLGKYEGDNRKIAARLVDYMNRSAKKAQRKKEKEFIETTVAKAIFGCIKQTESFSQPGEGRIAVIIGDAGHGKSVCLRQYAAVHPSAVYAKLNDTMTSTAMFAAIAAAMDLDSSGGLKSLTNLIAAHLAKRERTLLLDECSGLDVTKLNQLRQIIIEQGSTLILAGNNQLLKTISSDAARKGNEALDQFRSRMLAVLDLDAAAGAGGRDGQGGLYSEEDIRRLYNYGIKIDKGGISLLRRICCTPQTGRLRTVSIIISAVNNSKQAKSGEIENITAAVIEGAIRSLGLPVLDRLPLWTQPLQEEAEDAAVKAG